MNPELEKLLDITLKDGYLSDKERSVIRSRGERLGMSADEVDVIIDARLYEIQKNKTDNTNKCPKCGEQMTEQSVVCPACGFITNRNTNNISAAPDEYEDYGLSENRFKSSLDEDLRDLNYFANSIKNAEPEGFSKIIKSGLRTLFTGGIYLLYVKFKKKDTITGLFDLFEKPTQEYRIKLSFLRYYMEKKYKGSLDIENKTNETGREIYLLNKQRDKKATIAATITFAVVGILLFGITRVQLPVLSMKNPFSKLFEESAWDKTERYINAGRISDAKKTVNLIGHESTRDRFTIKIRDMEIDSLTNANDFAGALKLASTISQNGQNTEELERAVDNIVRKQVEYLYKQHKYDEAFEAAKLASYSMRSYLETSIKLYQSIYKSSKKK